MQRIGHLAAGTIILLLNSLVVALAMSWPGGRDYDEWAEWPTSWPNHGGGISNRREAVFEKKISRESVASLSLKWTVPTDFDVTATPAIDGRGGAVYFPSWDGCLYAVKKDTGELIWKVNLTQIAPTIPGLVEGTVWMPLYKSQYPTFPQLANLLCRSTPTIAGPLLLFGLYNPCYLLALNRSSGAVVWWRSLDKHPFCVFTQSGTYYEGYYYIGTSSEEEASLTCCTFQGAFFKVNAKTGKTEWRVLMLPDNHNQTGLYAGAAIWGSSPSIDVSRRLVYIATGNLYSAPPDIEACELALVNKTNRPIPDPCLLPGDHQESFVAINIDTSKIAWARHLGGYDTWTIICGKFSVPLPNCPKVLGQDFDFGEAPFLLTIKEEAEGPGSACRWRDIVVAGQKSGFVHALDRATGEIVWQTVAGPGGDGGGASWGMTTDGERVFTNLANNLHKNFTLSPSSTVITWGGWVAMNASTGAVLWSTANPAQLSTISPVSYANGVVFGASTGNSSGTPEGQIVALDAISGTVLWEYITPGGLGGGVSILDGCIFQPIGGSLVTFGVFNVSQSIHGHSTISLCVP